MTRKKNTNNNRKRFNNKAKIVHTSSKRFSPKFCGLGKMNNFPGLSLRIITGIITGDNPHDSPSIMSKTSSLK
jgi:hypothetical protein